MKKNIGSLLCYAVGLVFIISAYSKLIAPGIVEIILVDHGLASSRETAAIFVRILIGLEFAIGFLFFQKNYIKKFIVPAALLFLFAFTIYLIYTGYFLGDKQNCGCFGTMIEMSPLQSIIKNVFLIALLFAIQKLYTADGKKNLLPVLFFIIPVAAVFILSPVRSVRDFKFSGYTNFVGKGRVDLTEGDKLIAIYNTDCDHCQSTAKEIETLAQKSKTFPEFYALIFSEGTVSVDSFKTITGFNFPYTEINAGVFFDLIGEAPPRIYWLENGSVKKVWDKNFEKNINENFLNGN